MISESCVLADGKKAVVFEAAQRQRQAAEAVERPLWGVGYRPAPHFLLVQLSEASQ